MTELIVNADDLGLTRGVNEGILEAHARGIVTSASLMVERPAAADAATALDLSGNLSIGLHFVEDRAEILDDPNALAASFGKQLDRFRELVGRDPTHVDSHHHVHMSRLPAFAALVAPLGVPIRGDGSFRYIGGFYAAGPDGRIDPSRISAERLIALLHEHAGKPALELGCHPGRVDPDLVSSYREPRAIELATLTEDGLAARVHEAGFALRSFGA